MILSSKIIGSGFNNLIVLHGFLGMANNWTSYAKKISSSGFKVHLIDLRNHSNDKFALKRISDEINQII